MRGWQTAEQLISAESRLFETQEYGKSSISSSQELFTSTDNILILGGDLSTRQQFYEVLKI